MGSSAARVMRRGGPWHQNCPPGQAGKLHPASSGKHCTAALLRSPGSRQSHDAATL